GEGDEDPAGLLFGMIQFVKVVIHESIAEGQSWHSCMELTFYLPDEADDIIRMKTDGHIGPVRAHLHDKGADLVVHGIIIEILYNANDMKGACRELVIFGPDNQIKGILHAEHRYGGFINNDAGRIRRKLSEIEVAAFDDLHAKGWNIVVVDHEGSQEE